MIHNKTTKHIEEIRAYNNQIIGCKILESKGIDSINSTIYFMGIELTGGTESNLPYNECFFGELDSKDSLGLDTLKPIYHLIGEADYNTKDSKENFTQTLQVFLGSQTFTILNYSLSNSSLNIRLKCNSKESKAIVEKEQTQREQTQKESTTIDSITSTAMLYPILEDNELKCPHNGVVKLKSIKGKAFKSNNIPMILESDLINSPIIGCTNNIAGVPTPCSMVATILPNARALKKYNNDYPIMQDLVASGVMSDKGFPIICTPKPNKFKINAASLSNAHTQNKDVLESKIDTSLPKLSIITAYNELDTFYLTNTNYENREVNDSLIQSQSGFYNTYEELDISFTPLLNKDDDYKDLDSTLALKPILESLLKDYSLHIYSYRILTIRIAYTIYEYILLVPKKIPKFILKLLKEKRNKDELDYGYGNFVDLSRDYVRECSINDTKGENKEKNNTQISLLHIQGKVLKAPSGMERVRVEVR